MISEQSKKFSVKQIFQNHFPDFLKVRETREVERQEVEKMLSCKGLSRGCFIYFCLKCLHYIMIPFGCNSRICSCCAKRYTDKWAEGLMKKIIPGISHRHLVFSVPDILWWHIRQNRRLQKTLSDCAAETIKEVFCKTLRKEIAVGIIAVVHPFGRDMEFKPHVHVVATSGGFTVDNKFIKLGYVNYDYLHKTWQAIVLRELKKYLCQRIIEHCFRRYPNGFAAYLKPEVIWSGRHLVKYLGRYLRHPAIANSRICGYDGETVRFWFEDHKSKERVTREMSVFDFIFAVIQHIPEKNFKLIRYYGLYSRRTKKRVLKIVNKSFIKLGKLEVIDEKSIFHCPKCSEVMKFVGYFREPPDGMIVLEKVQGVYLVRLPEGR